jgi:hypothetical protein
VGQYFIPVFLNTAGTIVAALEPDDYGSGAKLAGHTRADVALMYAVLSLLGLDGGFRLVWAGDHADPPPGREANLYFQTQPPHFLRFDGLVAADVDPNAPLPAANTSELCGYVCNPDKGQYIANLTLPSDHIGWRRTPLPLLTADGGPACGDDRYATWAGDRIYYSRRHPGPGWHAVT